MQGFLSLPTIKGLHWLACVILLSGLLSYSAAAASLTSASDTKNQPSSLLPEERPVSLMIAYTPMVKQTYWNSDRSVQAAYLAILNHFNRTITAQSGLKARVALAGFVPLSTNSYSEGNDSRLLNALRWSQEFKNLRQQADDKRADLIQLVGKIQPGRGGRAEVNGRFSVIGHNQLFWQIVAHELAHNFGAVHHKAFRFNSDNATLMSVKARHRIAQLSNPLASWQRYIAGTAFHNNAELFNRNTLIKSALR